MDISILVGVFLASFIVSKAIGFEEFLNIFFHIESILIVLGGVMAAALVHFPFNQMMKIFSRIRVLFSMKRYDYSKTINMIEEMSKKVRAEGKVSVKELVNKADDHFLKMGMQLYLDNLSTENLRSSLEESIDYTMKRHDQGIQFFEQLSKYSPSFGLLGTVIGLIKLLSKLENPEAVGPGMSLALITTFYGVFLANLIFLPMAGRLHLYSQQELMQKEMILVGILSISNNEPSIVVREKMLMFLSEKDRKKSDKKAAKKEKGNGK